MTIRIIPISVGASVALCAAAALAALSGAVLLGYTAQFDRVVVDWLAALRAPGADAFFRAVTVLGSSALLVPATGVTVAVFALRRRWVYAGPFGVAYFAASLTTWSLKAAIGRERPEPHAAFEGMSLVGASFPSGHATHAAAFALAVCWLLPHDSGWRRPLAAALAATVLLVGASRVYLQAHWPSDVLGGLLVAATWAGAAKWLQTAMVTR